MNKTNNLRNPKPPKRARSPRDSAHFQDHFPLNLFSLGGERKVISFHMAFEKVAARNRAANKRIMGVGVKDEKPENRLRGFLSS